MKQVKSILIDKLIHGDVKNTQTEINGKWFIAKPLGVNLWIKRFKVAWRVFTGKSFAIHFKCDE